MCEDSNKAASRKTVLADATYFRMILQDGRWEYLQPKKFSGVVMLVPVTDDGRLVLIEQYRVPVDAMCVEIPAGLVGDETQHAGESLETAARRELLEETGYEADRVQWLCDGAPSAGSNSVLLSFFGCTGLKKVHAGGGVDDESIRVCEIPLSDVPAYLDRRRSEGAVIDLKVYTALFYAPQLIDGH